MKNLVSAYILAAAPALGLAGQLDAPAAPIATVSRTHVELTPGTLQTQAVPGSQPNTVAIINSYFGVLQIPVFVPCDKIKDMQTFISASSKDQDRKYQRDLTRQVGEAFDDARPKVTLDLTQGPIQTNTVKQRVVEAAVQQIPQGHNSALKVAESICGLNI